MNILQQAQDIVYNRSEEKTRQYGDFHTSMEIMSNISKTLTGKDITVKDCYLIMVALKLSRETYSHKEDNILDAVAYLASMNDYLNKQTK